MKELIVTALGLTPLVLALWWIFADGHMLKWWQRRGSKKYVYDGIVFMLKREHFTDDTWTLREPTTGEKVYVTWPVSYRPNLTFEQKLKSSAKYLIEKIGDELKRNDNLRSAEDFMEGLD